MLVFRSLADAAMKTRLFFRPFDLRRYAAVAAVTAFVGVRAGYGSITNLAAFVFFDGGVNATEPLAETVAETVDIFVLGVLAVAVATFVSALAEFVLIDLLRTDETRPRRFARNRLGAGARLFVFRLVATASFFIAAAGVASLVGSAPDGVVSLAVVAALAFGILVSLINGFTTDFVAPVMVVRDCSLVEGWRVFAHLLARKPSAFAGYAVVRAVANLLVAVGATVAALVVAAFYALPIAGLSLALGLTAEGFDSLFTTVAGFVLLVVVLVVYVVLVAASVAVLVQLPVRLLFRSWSLYFLGDMDEEYEMLNKPDPEEALEPLGTYLPGTYDSQDKDR